jgi:acetoin utilization protein AcuC
MKDIKTSRENVLVHSDDYANWVLGANHPTQGRRFTNAKKLLEKSMKTASKHLEIIPPRSASMKELERVHSEDYLIQVLKKYMCGEWSGKRPDLSELAALFAGGTLVALEKLLKGFALTGIHFPGAKHHAQKNHSYGFCVFADLALAADIATKDFGKRVAVFDIDAHHGDGTENLCLDNENVLTFSTHQYGIFPGTGNMSIPERLAFNYPLLSNGQGHDAKGDDSSLLRATDKFLEESSKFNPDLLFIACGADGYTDDPLSSLQFTQTGYVEVARKLRASYPNTPFLIGGAGGYLPDTATPEIWARFATEISA